MSLSEQTLFQEGKGKGKGEGEGEGEGGGGGEEEACVLYPISQGTNVAGIQERGATSSVVCNVGNELQGELAHNQVRVCQQGFCGIKDA